MPAAKSLADHKRHHDALLTAGRRDLASKLRWQIRARAKTIGKPVPKWAAPPKAPAPKPAKAANPKTRPRAMKPAAPPPLPFTPGQPLEIPRALREWRAAAGDRAISIASDGTVTLMRGAYTSKVKASFPSLDAAAAALEPPIEWEPMRVSLPAWTGRGTRASAARR